MLTRILAVVAPVIFLFFTACSGDSNSPPPNPVPQPQAVDKEMLDNLYNQAQRAKSSCTQDYTPIFIQIASAYQASSTCGAPIPGNPGVPVQGAPIAGGPVAGAPVIATFDPYGTGAQPQAIAGQMRSQCVPPVVQPLTQVQPQSSNCSNDLLNVMLTFNSIKMSNGVLYSSLPEAQRWLAQTLGGILAGVGGNIQGAGINLATNPQMQQFLIGTAANQVRNVILPTVQGSAPNAGQLFNQYAQPYL